MKIITTEEVLTPRTLAGLRIERVHKRSAYLNILVYGKSGVGKTRFAGSADAVPQLRPVLFVDIEGGTETLRSCYPDVDTARVTTWKEMQDLYDSLLKGEGGYQTVVLDSLTEIQKFNMYNIMENLTLTRPDLDPDIPGMREWGKNLEQIRRFVRAFRDLPMNTVFTALERQEKDGKTGAILYKPSLNGKAADEVAAFVDIVLYYYVKQVGEGQEAHLQRLMLAHATDNVIAKDRTGQLPMVVEEPTLGNIFDLIKGKKPQEASSTPAAKTEGQK